MASSFEKLEVQSIIDQLINYTIIENNKEIFKNMLPTNDVEAIKHHLMVTDEALLIINRYDRAPLYIFNNYYPLLDIVSKGGILSAEELYETIRLFQTISANLKQLEGLKKEQIACEYYKELVLKLYLDESLYEKLNKSVDEEGNVLDDASPTLKSIRNKLRNIDNRIKSKINEIMTKEEKKLSETFVTLRNDRYCIAVKAEYKNSVKGITHDVSGSYQTFYIEPAAVIELTSEKERLIQEEKQEIERILRALSNEVGNIEPILRINFDIILEIDNIFARAMLAKAQNASMPSINTDGRLNLVNARHPLLKVKKVIPNNVSFGDKYHGIVITGPNTGGKTVLLKTVGLLSTMVKYGLLIPADASSNVMVFDQIFCDIGDDQSIENNLSTFSSHMSNIVNIIDNVTPKSLVLIDEIGSGTDPVEGSNLATAILKHFIKNNINFITTTHYSALKAFAFENELVVNASMEFDDKSLEPTYKLKLGITGSSNAFNIAYRLGLNPAIIKDAKKMTATSSDQVRGLILKLEKQMKIIDEEKVRLENELSKTKEFNEKLKEEYSKIDIEKEKIIKKANKEAQLIIDNTNVEASQIIEKLKKMEKRETKLHEIIAVKEELKKIDENKVEEVKNEITEEKYEFKVGDDVYIKDYDQYGVINKIIKKDLFSVSIGNIVANFKQNELKLVKPNKQKTIDASKNISFTKKSTVKLTLDLRGCRYEEAKDLLDEYIDDLVCANIKQANIIHGYGTGVIRELVQNFLKRCSHIASYRYGGEGEGGFGVTVITLK